MNTIKKRSINIAGHTTSVSLEEEFWQELVVMASDKNISVNRLVTDIDALRISETNLSSAIRLYILNDLKLKLLATQ